MDTPMEEKSLGEAPITGDVDAKTNPPSDIAMMSEEEEREKMLKAARQSEFLLHPNSLWTEGCLCYLVGIVEFYFADSNLPYDRWVSRNAFAQHLDTYTNLDSCGLSILPIQNTGSQYLL